MANEQTKVEEKKSVEVSAADAAQASKEERQAQQIPQRRDEVVAPGEKGLNPEERDQKQMDKSKDAKAGKKTEAEEARAKLKPEHGGNPKDAEQSPSKPWADYASKQEELYKKNQGVDIERNVDGTVKP